jgi:hypothetical protein
MGAPIRITQRRLFFKEMNGVRSQHSTNQKRGGKTLNIQQEGDHAPIRLLDLAGLKLYE